MYIKQKFYGENISFFDDGTIQLYDEQGNDSFLVHKKEVRLLYDEMKKHFDKTNTDIELDEAAFWTNI